MLKDSVKLQDILFVFFNTLIFFNTKNLITFEVLKNNDKNYYSNKTISKKNSLISNECATINRVVQSNFFNT